MSNEQQRREPGPGEPMQGKPASAPEGTIATLVCEICGKDYSFEDEQPPAGLKCEKCGGTVFRAFHETVGEAADDFRESTERDLDPDDPEGDTLPGDILDLNRL